MCVVIMIVVIECICMMVRIRFSVILADPNIMVEIYHTNDDSKTLATNSSAASLPTIFSFGFSVKKKLL